MLPPSNFHDISVLFCARNFCGMGNFVIQAFYISGYICHWNKNCDGTDFKIIFNFYEYDFTSNSLLITSVLGKKF